MDTIQIGVTLGGINLIGLTLWFFFGKGTQSRPKGGAGDYSCPMHPWITSADPSAECSVCGMKLVRAPLPLK
jgi:hypothetical protein